MNDKFKQIKGHIKIECLDTNKNVIDSFELHNLIMDKARLSASALACGITGAKPVNKFVLGTQGHKSGDYLTAKTESDGFVSSRTQLFSEETLDYTYPIAFTNPGTSTGSCVVTSEPDSGSTVDLTLVNSTVTYTIVIPELSANNLGTVAFTEAALYCGSDIFSMKCFPAKIKDNTTSIRVIWSIIF